VVSHAPIVAAAVEPATEFVVVAAAVAAVKQLAVAAEEWALRVGG
jgi:hypothetical protein